MGADKPLRMPIIDRYRDMGTIVMGKLESGCVEKGQTILMMPNKASVEVMQVWADDEEVDSAMAGDNVKLKLKNMMFLPDLSCVIRRNHVKSASASWRRFAFW